MLYKTPLVFILRFVIVWHSPLKLCQYEANLRLNCSGYEFTDINIPHTGIICWITSHYWITNDPILFLAVQMRHLSVKTKHRCSTLADVQGDTLNICKEWKP